MKTAADIMTKKVISTRAETPLIEAVNILFRYNFNGLPVLDGNDKLVGILTEYDLVVKGSSVHLPTFLRLFSEIDLYQKGGGPIREDLKRILNTKVKDVMNPEPLTLLDSVSIEEVIKTFQEHHRVNPIPILNRDGELAGIISRSDTIKPFKVSGINFKKGISQREIDENVNKFISNLESNFTVVSKLRTRLWILASLLFIIVGFTIAWFLILRVEL